tara:strand:+ start:11320 stop:12177 length:858 start_codon:yes stop_codon:yes gene_type:complete
LTKLINGKEFADKLCDKLASEVLSLHSQGVEPCIAVILVGDDPASHVYVKNKIRRCEQVHIRSLEFRFEDTISEQALLEKIEDLNGDSKVHGILVQLPLPEHINDSAIIAAISPAKDVDGFHKESAGALMLGQDGFVPCTPLGSLMLLGDVLPTLSGLHAVIVGRSNIVGKPMASLLLAKNCTVTIAHSRTQNLPDVCKQADILVAAVGKPELIRGGWVKPGAVVIDVGINRVMVNDAPKLKGDVCFDEVKDIASAITPVPGGVGPMTIACLMYNTVEAARKQAG